MFQIYININLVLFLLFRNEECYRHQLDLIWDGFDKSYVIAGFIKP